jgi:hypothetical protein
LADRTIAARERTTSQNRFADNTVQQTDGCDTDLNSGQKFGGSSPSFNATAAALSPSEASFISLALRAVTSAISTSQKCR